jgi:hypothetical protein
MKSFAVIPAKAGIQKRTWIPGRVALARNDKYLLPFILKEALMTVRKTSISMAPPRTTCLPFRRMPGGQPGFSWI